MDNKIRSFKDLIVWQKAHALALRIYAETKDFPNDERFGLSLQMRRSAVSISSNIAEGFSRRSKREKVYFFAIARGSLTELESQLTIAKDINYISDSVFRAVDTQLQSVHKLINSFIRSARSKPEGD